MDHSRKTLERFATSKKKARDGSQQEKVGAVSRQDTQQTWSGFAEKENQEDARNASSHETRRGMTKLDFWSGQQKRQEQQRGTANATTVPSWGQCARFVVRSINLPPQARARGTVKQKN
jgi:hypothetical protein